MKNMGKMSILLILAYIVCSCRSISQTNNSVLSSHQFQSTLIDPQHITKVGEDHYFIDFGKDAFGTLVLNTKFPQSDTLIVHLGEKTINPTTIDREPGGTIRYQKVQLTDLPVNKEYIVKLKPDERNTNPPAIALPDSFGVIMPFRYCEIENLKVPVTDISIRQKVYNYRFNDKSSNFVCSDTVLNQVWDLCKYTIKATSFAGLYIDGDRERIPYEADAYINQLSHYCVDSEYALARKTNEYFINHPTWPTEWILHTVLLFYNDYLYTGNIESVSMYYDALKSKTLTDLEREDGLISSKSPLLTSDLLRSIGITKTIIDIVDWPEGERDGYDMADVNTVVNSFHYINLRLMAEIAGYLGKKADSVNFQNRSMIVKNTINQKLFDRTKGIYIDGENSGHSSLHANMFPLAFGLVPDENLKTVVAFVKSRGMACSVYGAQYLLEALYQQGEADYALSLMTSTGNRSWWNMIRIGSTIAVEAWDMKYKPNSDWNHAWGAAPANIVTRYMWGITPAEPGFTKVKIEPQLSHLTFSKIKVPTIKGTITAEYKVINGKDNLFIIELPKDIKGEFILSHGENSTILVNDKKIKAYNSTVYINPGSNRIEIRNNLL
jgi:alpha-L-rhamnosidase